jgi:hypothetical protein
MLRFQLRRLCLILAFWPSHTQAGELDLPAAPDSSGCNLSLIGGQSRAAFDSFDQALRAAVKGPDAQNFIPLLAFPLRVNRDGGVMHIRNEKEFLKEASRIFTPGVREAVTKTAGFFCHSSGLTYGNGTVWVVAMSSSAREQYGISAINVPEVDPSAADHPLPRVECLTPRHRIVIDRVRDDLRYRSWSRSKEGQEKPDLELHKGRESREGTGACRYAIFAFRNGTTHYVFTEPGCTEKEPPAGSRGELEITRKDKVLARWWCLGG